MSILLDPPKKIWYNIRGSIFFFFFFIFLSFLLDNQIHVWYASSACGVARRAFKILPPCLYRLAAWKPTFRPIGAGRRIIDRLRGRCRPWSTSDSGTGSWTGSHFFKPKKGWQEPTFELLTFFVKTECVAGYLTQFRSLGDPYGLLWSRGCWWGIDKLFEQFYLVDLLGFSYCEFR